MSRISIRAACVFMMLAGAALAGSDKGLRQVPVTPEFSEGEIKWRGGPNLGYLFRWQVQVHEGFLAICGAGAEGEHNLRSATRKVMRRAYIEFEGRKILEEMTFFNRVKRRSGLDLAMANCWLTDVPAPMGNFEVHLITLGATARD